MTDSSRPARTYCRSDVSDLLSRIEADATVVFEDASLTLLRTVRQNGPTEFERIRTIFKQAGGRVGALDKALNKLSESRERAASSQADALLKCASDADLFHAPNGVSYADIIENGRRQTHAVRSELLQQWLVRGYYKNTGRAPSSEAINSVLGILEARARFDGEERPVFIRVGRSDDCVYVDIGDPSWQAIEIDQCGWRIIEAPPVRFVRPRGFRSLPFPLKGKTIDCLRPHLNLAADDDFVLAVAWLLVCFRAEGPYPLLALNGEQGSGKSSLARRLIELVDPRKPALRSLPREERDLAIAAANSHVLAFDNISYLPASTSDALCRLATGAGFATRKLHRDSDEVLFDAARPVILNGIETFVTRPDLADRCLHLSLKPIEVRQTEAALSGRFEEGYPYILGALLDGVVAGLGHHPAVTLEGLPRMADFAQWAAACETAYWQEGTFLDAYRRNEDEMVRDLLDADVVGAAICGLMEAENSWTGTATELVQKLHSLQAERLGWAASLPSSPRALSASMTRIAPVLRKMGIVIQRSRVGRRRERRIEIRKLTF